MDLFDDKKPRRGKSLKRNTLRVTSSSNSGSSGSGKANELVLKVASNIKGNNAGGSIDYITRNKEEHEQEQFISPENEMGEKLNAKEVNELSEEWKKEFTDPKKINTRNMTHFVISVDIKDNEKNRNSLDNAARGFLNDRFGDEGFRYIYVQHNDTKKPHVHVLVNNNNLETNKKLRIDMNWLYESRAMMKEHLKNHGIKQEATFKKDRQFLQEKNKESKQDYKNVSNWFDAKLKTASRNDEHFQQLQKQWTVIKAANSEIGKSEKLSSQKQIELRKKIENLKADMITYDNYSNRSTANNAVKEVIKDSKLSRDSIQGAISQFDKKQTRTNEKELRRNYFLAKELVKGEAILNASKNIPPKEKKQILSIISEQKKRFSSQGIDVAKLESNQKIELSGNEKLVTTAKLLNKAESSLDRQIKRDGALDQAKATNQVKRILDSIHSTKKTDLTPNEKGLLSNKKTEVFDAMRAKGVDTKKIEDGWIKSRQLKDSVMQVKAALENVTEKNSNNIDSIQKTLFSIKKNLQVSPPEQMSKKETYTQAVKLTRMQGEINSITSNKFEKLEKDTNNLVNNLTSLKEKIRVGENKKVSQQSFMMIKKLTTVEQNISSKNLLPSQKEHLTKKTNTIKQDLENIGINVNKLSADIKVSVQLREKLVNTRDSAMSRAKIIGYDATEKTINELQNTLKQSGLTRKEKQTWGKELKVTKEHLNSSRALDANQLTKQISEIRKLSSEIEKRTDKDYTKTLTNIERLSNKRQVEKLRGDLGKLVEQSKPLINSISDKTQKATFRKDIRDASQLSQSNSQFVGRTR